jgi:hypothetical protein
MNRFLMLVLRPILLSWRTSVRFRPCSPNRLGSIPRRSTKCQKKEVNIGMKIHDLFEEHLLEVIKLDNELVDGLESLIYDFVHDSTLTTPTPDAVIALADKFFEEVGKVVNRFYDRPVTIEYKFTKGSEETGQFNSETNSILLNIDNVIFVQLLMPNRNLSKLYFDFKFKMNLLYHELIHLDQYTKRKKPLTSIKEREKLEMAAYAKQVSEELKIIQTLSNLEKKDVLYYLDGSYVYSRILYPIFVNRQNGEQLKNLFLKHLYSYL